MSREPAGAGATSRPFILVGLLLLSWGVANWRAVPAGVWHDDGVYMVVGEALAEGSGLTYGGVPGAPPAVKFPPGYSVLLAALWLVLPGPGAVTLAATVLNLCFLATAGALLAWGLHRFAALEPKVAAAVAGMAFVATDIWRLALVPLSEPLFILLLIASLIAAGRVLADGPPWWVGGLLAVLLVTALLVRSAGLAAVLGVCAALAFRGRYRDVLIAALPSAGAYAAWSAWSSRGAERLSPESSDVLGPYGAWLGGQLLAAPGAFVQRLPSHAAAVLERVVALMVPGASGWLAVAGALVLLPLAVRGSGRLLRDWPAVPWVAAAYLGMLLVWPFADRRLVAPLHPLLMVMVGVGAWSLWPRDGRAGGGRSRLRYAWLTGIGVWGAAHLLVSANRAAREWTVAPYRLRAERLAVAVEALGRVAPADAVVGAPEFWAALHLHGGWQTTPSALFRPRSDDDATPVWGSPTDQLQLWWDAGATHLLLEQGGQIHGEALNLLEATCPGSATIPARLPPQMIVALTWGPDCAGRLGLRDPSP